MAAEDVLVIGAGPAGLASAYALEKEKIAYKVIDRAKVVGSTWHGLYPSLKLNTSRFYSHMPGMRFPLHYGIFASGREYHLYLEAFNARHRFNIHLGIDVQRVAPEDGVWRVETSEGVEHYPAVISATGVYSNPIWPDIPGLHDFKGTLMHSHDFTDPSLVTGKRVLVVGNGPSGVDVSVAAAETAQNPVHISIRSGISLSPRWPLGLPKHAWMMIAERLPKPWCERLMRQINQVAHRIPDDSPLKPFTEQSSGSAIPYRGPELIEAVHGGKVEPVRAPIQFYEHSVEFADGSAREFDVVVLATSYRPALHNYLDIEMQFSDEPQESGPCDWQLGPNGKRGWPLRDVSQHPNGRQVLGYPGLYLVGVFYKGKGAMYNFSVEAEVAAQQIKDYLRNHYRWGGV